MEPGGEEADADEAPVGEGEGGSKAAVWTGLDAEEAEGAVYDFVVMELVGILGVLEDWAGYHM